MKTVAMQIAQIQRNRGYRNQNADVIAVMKCASITGPVIGFITLSVGEP
jgi:hypothetical protein